MAKCIGVIYNGIEYEPDKLPQEVKEEIQNKLIATIKKQQAEGSK